MDILLGLLALVVAIVVVRKIVRYKPLTPMFPLKYNFGKRRDTFRRTMDLLERRGAKMLVETGVARRGLASTRGGGASTFVFGLWAKEHGARLHSVDIDPEAIAFVEPLLSEMGIEGHVTLHVSDSVEFLAGFREPVDFLYLDSYDYDKQDAAVQEASQAHHLAEFKAVEERLHAESVVLIDDCDLPGGGKGRTVIEYMQSRGWRLDRYEYQALLVRDAA